MITDKRIANAVSGKTARACDCCIKKRARWYCPADDAFLCQSCDGTVHSANSLARRHERVRLKTASFMPSSECDQQQQQQQQREDLPWWHRGLTRKPRTPRRQGKQQSLNNNVIVPELCMEDTTSSQDGETETETEEQLLYRVPVFDPYVVTEQEYDMTSDLQDFAADVETLLGKGLDDETSYGIEELGLLDCSPHNPIIHQNCSDIFVKEEVQLLGCQIQDVINEPFELTFNSEEDDHKEILMIEQSSLVNDLCKLNRDDEKEGLERRKILLNLDYDAISAAWASHGSPWINGQRPEIDLDDCWPHCMETCGHQGRHPLFGDNQMGGIAAIRDGGREARVSRYREKRRTRLFSKKIRYEVRKLNAEKRPRMKGRFVKRSSFLAAATAAFPLVPKK